MLVMQCAFSVTKLDPYEKNFFQIEEMTQQLPDSLGSGSSLIKLFNFPLNKLFKMPFVYMTAIYLLWCINNLGLPGFCPGSFF